jgi:hypothetical protein
MFVVGLVLLFALLGLSVIGVVMFVVALLLLLVD